MECLAYNGDGTVCRKPATALDEQRGCVVCDEHAPKSARRFAPLARLQPNFVVRFQNRSWRVSSVNDCRAVIVPVDRTARQYVPQTGKDAGKVVQFLESGAAISICPEAELPIVGKWDPVKQEVVG